MMIHIDKSNLFATAITPHHPLHTCTILVGFEILILHPLTTPTTTIMHPFRAHLSLVVGGTFECDGLSTA
jgi:hypothetical protein